MSTSSSFEVSANGTVFGVYSATNEQEARDLCAQDAGYKSEADMMAQLDQPSDLVARELSAWAVWEDGKKDDALTVAAASMPDALDVAAQRHGFIDYADMAQAREWGESDGLNIEAASD